MNFINLLIVLSLSASPELGPDPVRLLFLDASSCKFAIMQKSLSTHTEAEIAAYDADRVKARADMEKHAPAAITSGGDSPELKDAIKSFYIAASAYCENPSSATDDEYKTQKKSLDNKLRSSGR